MLFVSWFIRQRYFLCKYHLLHFCVIWHLSLCFLHFCVIFLRYSTLKMYFCSEIYQRTLARLAYMTDIKDFFIASNTVHNAPDYDSNVLSTLIHTVEAFARVTYQSVYLIDYYRQEFLYVSDNPLFLCGHTAKEVKELGDIVFIWNMYQKTSKKCLLSWTEVVLSSLILSTMLINTNVLCPITFIWRVEQKVSWLITSLLPFYWQMKARYGLVCVSYHYLHIKQ